MAIDWDAELLAPVMAVFGEGDPADHSTWPTYTTRQGVTFPLTGAVFDRAYTEAVLASDGSENTSRKPCLGVRAALFDADPVQGDTVYIPSVSLTFMVKDVQDDGHGHIKLLLQQAKR